MTIFITIPYLSDPNSFDPILFNIKDEGFDGMEAFKDRICFSSEKWPTQEKVFQRFYFRTTVAHGTHSIPQIMSEFVFI